MLESLKALRAHKKLHKKRRSTKGKAKSVPLETAGPSGTEFQPENSMLPNEQFLGDKSLVAQVTEPEPNYGPALINDINCMPNLGVQDPNSDGISEQFIGESPAAVAQGIESDMNFYSHYGLDNLDASEDLIGQSVWEIPSVVDLQAPSSEGISDQFLGERSSVAQAFEPEINANPSQLNQSNHMNVSGDSIEHSVRDICEQLNLNENGFEHQVELVGWDWEQKWQQCMLRIIWTLPQK